MDRKKRHDKVSRNALYEGLILYGKYQRFLNAVKSFYNGGSTCVRLSGSMSERSERNVGVQQDCEITQWLFTVSMNRALCKWELSGMISILSNHG